MEICRRAPAFRGNVRLCPGYFKAVYGYQLNDKITLDYTDESSGKDKSLTFTVKGYTEDIFSARQIPA